MDKSIEDINKATTSQEASANIKILQKRMESMPEFTTDDIRARNHLAEKMNTPSPLNTLHKAAYSEGNSMPDRIMRGVTGHDEQRELSHEDEPVSGEENAEQELDTEPVSFDAGTLEIRKRFDALMQHNDQRDNSTEYQNMSQAYQQTAARLQQVEQELSQSRERDEERDKEDTAYLEDAIMSEIMNARLSGEVEIEARLINKLSDHQAKKHIKAFMKAQEEVRPRQPQYNPQAQPSIDYEEYTPKEMPVHKGFPKAKPSIKEAGVQQAARSKPKETMYIPPEFVDIINRINLKDPATGKPYKNAEDKMRRVLENKSRGFVYGR